MINKPDQPFDGSGRDAGPSPVRVLLVDDQELVRYGFRVILDLADGIEVVGEAGDGEQAVRLAGELRPDVICMDVQMPVKDGLAATRELVADHRIGAAVLILTTLDRDDYLFQALEAGASGFLLKNASPENLVEAVRVIAAGDALLSPAVTRRVISSFAGRDDHDGHGRLSQQVAARTPNRETVPGRDRSEDPHRPVAPTPALTDRESEVLQLVAQGMSNAEIAAHLVVGEATVKTHVSNVLSKLQLRDRIQAVIYAYEHRLVTPAP